MKPKLKVIIIICVFIVLLISIILLLVNSNQQNKNENIQNIEQGNGKIEATYKLKTTKSIPSYITVNNCANKFFNYIKEDNMKALKSLLINDYKTNEASMNQINYDCQFNADVIFEYEAKVGIKTYLVKGHLLNKDKKTSEELLLIVNVDYTYNTFEIAPLEGTYSDYLNYSNFENIEVSKEIEKEISNIKENEYNKAEIANGLRE